MNPTRNRLRSECPTMNQKRGCHGPSKRRWFGPETSTHETADERGAGVERTSPSSLIAGSPHISEAAARGRNGEGPALHLRMAAFLPRSNRSRTCREASTPPPSEAWRSKAPSPPPRRSVLRATGWLTPSRKHLGPCHTPVAAHGPRLPRARWPSCPRRGMSTATSSATPARRSSSRIPRSRKTSTAHAPSRPSLIVVAPYVIKLAQPATRPLSSGAGSLMSSHRVGHRRRNIRLPARYPAPRR